MSYTALLGLPRLDLFISDGLGGPCKREFVSGFMVWKDLRFTADAADVGLCLFIILIY
jgi:hypothetical protein